MRHALLATALVLVAGSLAAQEGQKWLILEGGWDAQESTKGNGRGVKDNPIVGLGFGTWCTSRWGGAIDVLGTQLKAKTGNASANETHANLAVLFNVMPNSSAWIPYLRAGAGASQVDAPWSYSGASTTRFSWHAGAGVQALLKQNLTVGLEARGVRVETKNSASEALGLVYIGYRWGSQSRKIGPPAAAPEPAPAPAPVMALPAPPPPPPPPPAPEPVVIKAVPPPPPPPPPVEVKAAPMKIVLDEAVLHFANGKNDLPPEGVRAIGKVAESVKRYKGKYTLVVTGYTSSVGGVAFNKALSKRRADAVAKVLVDAGIPAAAIQTAGAGPDNPIADNKTKEGQARNRRVEIEIKADQAVETRKNDTPVS